MSQPRIICTWTSPQRGLARETSHLYCFWLAVLVTGAGSQTHALCEWDHSFQALVVPAVAHSAFPPSVAAWKNFSFPLVCRGLKISPSACNYQQCIYSGKLNKAVGLAWGQASHQWVCHPERAEQHRGAPGSLHGPAGSQIRKTAPRHCCTQAKKPPGRGRLAGSLSRELCSLDLFRHH